MLCLRHSYLCKAGCCFRGLLCVRFCIPCRHIGFTLTPEEGGLTHLVLQMTSRAQKDGTTCLRSHSQDSPLGPRAQDFSAVPKWQRGRVTSKPFPPSPPLPLPGVWGWEEQGPLAQPTWEGKTLSTCDHRYARAGHLGHRALEGSSVGTVHGRDLRHHPPSSLAPQECP